MSNVMYNFFIKHFPAQYNATLFQEIQKNKHNQKTQLEQVMDYVYQICRFACSYTKTEHHPLIKSKIRILSKTKTFPISRQEEFQACLKRNVLKLCQIKRNYLINYFFCS